jgi:superfamily II DNA or RNA helicase
MTETLDAIASRIGLRFFDYQIEALINAGQQTGPAPRLCLYYKTGAGKTLTALAAVKRWGHNEVVVIAPPSTHNDWMLLGFKLKVVVECMSHAKFRAKNVRLSRTKAIIADEFHLFGGHRGQGWTKLKRLAQGLEAPLVLASATPNYNDAERVFCIQSILDPMSVKGGYIQFLYDNCELEANPFGREPLVVGFIRHANAAEYLAALPLVEYLEDDLVYQIVDHMVPTYPPDELTRYGFNRRRHRIIASAIEERHTLAFQGLVGQDGRIHQHVLDHLDTIGAVRPVLIFCAHATVAEALDLSLADAGLRVGLVTGQTPAKKKSARLEAFKDGVLDVLVGTATLATGTDGLDKVCDWLVIFDDTDDDALRRQLIGRIMPRGMDVDASRKNVHRLVLQ